MKNCRKKDIGDNYNGGFTLIEMIVTVAIIAIFSGVIVTFITGGSSFYKNTSSNSKVQMETQKTFDRLEDMIINANRNIGYGTSENSLLMNDIDQDSVAATKVFVVSSGDDDSETEITTNSAVNQELNQGISVMSMNDTSSSTTSSQYDPQNDTERQYIIWNKTEKTIRYIDCKKINNKWQNVTQGDDILATGVLDFQADISKAISDKIVRFQLYTQNGKKKVKTLHSVSLRNEMGITDEIDMSISDPVIPAPSEEPTPAITVAPTTEPQPYSLTANMNSVLMGAGNSLDLSQIVTWTLRYDNGEQKQSGLKLTWTSDCRFAQITEDGRITVNADAGTAESGEIKITVTEKDSEMSGDFMVKVARIDIISPDGYYAIGDKKEWEYTYMEGGIAKKNVIPVTTVTEKPEEATDYFDVNGTMIEGEFAESDVGIWTIIATIDLKNRNGIGSVSGVCTFSVVGENDIEIITPQNNWNPENAYVVTRNYTYTCRGGGDFWLDGITWDGPMKITWSLQGDFDVELVPVPGNDNFKEIKTGANAEGFVLCATYTKYADWNYSTELWHKTAKKYISVVTGKTISTIPSTVKVGTTFDMAVDINLSSAYKGSDGKYKYRTQTVREKNGENNNIIRWTPEGNTTCLKTDDLWQKLTILPLNGNSLNTVSLTATIEKLGMQIRQFANGEEKVETIHLVIEE